MKKILTVLLIVTMILSLSACDGDRTESNYSDGNNNTTTTQSNIEKELTDIEKALGKIANDYLNTNITEDETEEKLDVLYSRVENVGDYVSSAVEEFMNSDDFKSDPYDLNTKEFNDQKHYYSVSNDILAFRSDILLGETSQIIEIRDNYYKS